MPDHEYFFDDAVGVCSKGENFIVRNLSFTHVIIGVFGLTVFHSSYPIRKRPQFQTVLGVTFPRCWFIPKQVSQVLAWRKS